MFMSSTMPAYAIGFFITNLLFIMGFSVTEALVLSAPPYVAAVSTCSPFLHSTIDTTCKPGYFVLFLCLALR